VTLQPFVRPWPLLQFRKLFYIHGRTPWVGDQPVARPLPTRRTTQTHTKTSMPFSGIRTHDPSVRASEDNWCLRLRGRPLWSTFSVIVSQFSQMSHEYDQWAWLICYSKIHTDNFLSLVFISREEFSMQRNRYCSHVMVTAHKFMSPLFSSPDYKMRKREEIGYLAGNSALLWVAYNGLFNVFVRLKIFKLFEFRCDEFRD
jgi:hypothetical protein